MPFIPRKSWDEVYNNQNILLNMLQNIDGIFLGGGTAIQRFHTSFQARESDDLDFFIVTTSSSLVAKKAIEIRKSLENHKVRIENYISDSGVHRFICKLNSSEERVKVELIDCTTERFSGRFTISTNFPRIENKYDLILYKLKALYDRQDTIKDLFDLYFLFKEYSGQPISQMKLFMDLKMKFQASTGYIYSEADIIEALQVNSRQWDIVLRPLKNIHQHEIEDAIDEFRKSFLTQINNSNMKYFYLSYQDTAKIENNISTQDFYEFIEPNMFITYAYNQYKTVKETSNEYLN